MKTIISKVLLVVILIAIQYTLITGGNYDFFINLFNNKKVDNEIIVQNKVEDVNKETIQKEIQSTPKIVEKDINQTIIITTKKDDTIKVSVDKIDTNTTNEIVNKVDKNESITVAQEKQEDKVIVKNKIITMSQSLIRNTPVLDKTKANAIGFEEKGVILEYEKELTYWYYLGNDRYIHKSVVKKLEQ